MARIEARRPAGARALWRNGDWIAFRTSPLGRFHFFTDKSLQRATLDEAFPFLERSVVLQQQPHTLTVLVPGHEAEGRRAPEQSVKLSFFGNRDFGRIDEPEFTEDGVLNVASLDDLMATKLKVLLQRVEAKDYKDIAAMLEADVSLAVAWRVRL